MTGTGKSTLSTWLIKQFVDQYPRCTVLVMDSKPRYRATHYQNGRGLVYRHWVKGDVLEDSVVIHHPKDFKNARKMARVIIYQSMRPNADAVIGYEAGAALLADQVFRSSYDEHPTLLYIDEYYDLLRGGLAATIDRRLLKTIRAGRERNMAVLVSAQRPRSIPLPTLTEASKYYLFYMEYEQDVKYMRQHGPKLHSFPTGHQFIFYERLDGAKHVERLMQLRFEATDGRNVRSA